MDFDLDELARLRADTPGCAGPAHFHHCGASLMPQPVVSAQYQHIALESAMGGYEAEWSAAAEHEAVYDAVAALLNATRDEIALVESATVGWQRAFLALTQDLGPTDRLLTGVAAYGSNYLSYLRLAERQGVQVEVIPDDPQGQIDLNVLAERLPGAALVALTHVPTNSGLVNPAAEVGALARQAGVPFLLDACQSAGQLPLDVRALGCDVLTASARKFLRGPRGVGFLFVRGDRLPDLKPVAADLRAADWTAPERLEWSPTARRFETWEASVAGRLAMGAAVRYALDVGMDRIWARARGLADALRAGLAELPHVTLRDKGAVRGAIVPFTVAGHAPAEVQQALAGQCLRVGISEVGSTRLDLSARGLTAVVRAAPHYINTEDEVAALIAAVGALPAR